MQIKGGGGVLFGAFSDLGLLMCRLNHAVLVHLHLEMNWSLQAPGKGEVQYAHCNKPRGEIRGLVLKRC